MSGETAWNFEANVASTILLARKTEDSAIAGCEGLDAAALVIL